MATADFPTKRDLGNNSTQLKSVQSRTELGRHLRKLRQRIVKSGVRLLTPDEIDAELAARRGEHPEA